MNPITTGILVVAGVALAAWLLRRFSGTETIDREVLGGGDAGPLPATSTASSVADELPEEDEAEGPEEIAAITSEGMMFIPFEKGVQMLLPATPDQLAAEMLSEAVSRSRVVGVLSAGDLVAARVVRGAPGLDPWRLEALGRDREYLAWSFETEEAGRAALDLLERIVVRVPPGEDGEPAPAGPADFAEALRLHEQTVHELATMPESEEPGEPR